MWRMSGSLYENVDHAKRRCGHFVFRRQLETTGDTELELHVKNFLDGLEPETLPYHRVIDHILRRSLAVADGFDKIRSRLSDL